MTIQILHVSFIFRNRVPEIEIEETLNNAMDWIRYSETCWLVKTHKSPTIWSKRLQKVMGAGNSVLVVRIDPKARAGKMPRAVWDWLRGALPNEA